MKSKEAQRRKQLKAQKRKRQSAQKAKVKSRPRPPSAAGVTAIGAAVHRWMHLGPAAMPVEQSCPGCSGRIGAQADGDALVFLHTEPHCAAYDAFSRSVDESNEEEDSIAMGETLSQVVPPWAHGPSTELTEEQGEKLLDSGEVLVSCQVLSTMMTAMIYARTKDGLFQWNVTIPDIDEDDEDEISEVSSAS